MVCTYCGKDKPDVSERFDPFSFEINDEEIEVDICDDCYAERRDEI